MRLMDRLPPTLNILADICLIVITIMMVIIMYRI
jgi:hypothetical protein